MVQLLAQALHLFQSLRHSLIESDFRLDQSYFGTRILYFGSEGARVLMLGDYLPCGDS
jgi:hypothetical protein